MARHVDRRELPGAVQSRQTVRVAPIGLDPIPAALGDHRGAHHRALFSLPREVTVDVETARARLVDKVELLPLRAKLLHRLVERLEVAADRAVVAHLPVAPAVGDRNVDGLLVDIHPHERVTLLHDLPPRLWLCAER